MKRTNFESINEELMSEITMARALEMDNWLSSLELDPSIDTSFLDEAETFGDDVVMLDEDDLKTAQGYEILGRQTSDMILLHAVNAMRGMEDQDLDEDIEACSDCGEWLQLHRSSIRNCVKSSLKCLNGAGYDLDDLVQEANLAIFEAWNKFDTSCKTRDEFCRSVIYNRMIHLYRAARADKRGFAVTESLDAVTLAHSDLEWINGDVTWTSLAGEEGQINEVLTMEDLNMALTNIQEMDREILSMLAKGYTQEEIAESIERTQSFVSYVAGRSRKKLKAAIA